jgi:ribosomal protein S18 acetylase RimI-like enzyme
MPAVLRPLRESDLPFAHGLSRAAGWNQTRRDWERFLFLAPGGCFLAMDDGCPAGTATTTAYRDDLAWIGMVLVEPAFRRRGIGTALLEAAIGHLRERGKVACIRLDATPQGRPLYEGLGFFAEWNLRRWVRNAAPTTAPTATSAPDPPLSDPDDGAETVLPASSLALDRAVFGADRSLLLASLRTGSDDAILLPDGSFGFRRAGERAHYLGPVTAASNASGLALAERLLSRCPHDRPLFWDLPEANESASDLAFRLGFEPARVLTRMRLGEDTARQDPARIFGLAEPGLG